MKTKYSRVLSSWWLLLVAIPFVAGCPARPHDAGDASFVRQAIPILLGRRPINYDEVKLFSDIMDSLPGLEGRRVVMRALMAEDEYVEHWATVVADWMKIDRQGSIGQADTFQGDCWNVVGPAGDTPDLAAHVRDSPPTAPWPAGGAAPGLGALVRSALRLDDLSTVFRAHLFAMVSHPEPGNNISEKNRREAIAADFMDIYVNKQLDCTGCHNAKWSTTGEGSGWDRSWNVPGFFEKALFGYHAGRPLEDVAAVFRTASNSNPPTNPPNANVYPNVADLVRC